MASNAQPTMTFGELDSMERTDTLKRVALVALVALVTLQLLHFIKGFARFHRIRRTLSALPDAPGSNWLLGHVFPLLNGPKTGKGSWDVIESWANALGPICRFRVLNTQCVVIQDPLAVKRVFQTRFKVYAKDLNLSYHPFLPILGTGLVTSDGDLWQKQRLLIGPALRVDILDDIVGIAKRATDRLSAKLEALRGTGTAVCMEEEFRLLTLQVIGEAILSLPPEECDSVFPHLYLPVMEEANQRVLRPHRKYLPTPAWWAFRRRMAHLNHFLLTLIRGRWAARQQAAGAKAAKGDILDRILSGIEEAGTKWDAALEQQLCYEIKTFLLAGHETSAAMLMWSVYELSKQPEALAAVRAEAEVVFGDSDGEPPRRAVDAMPYTLAVLKEALRKYSVVPVVTRELQVDDELCGYPIPEGTMVVVCIQAIHNQWHKPASFSPDRFLPGGEYESFDEAVRAYMYLPFIQGPRNCLGQHLALLEARVVLALLCKRFTLTPASSDVGQRHPTVIPVASIGGMPMLVE